MMKYILCYGDSNTWGASPDQLPRFGFETRWPGVVQRLLGGAVHVYENGLCGRTTGFTDDVELGRNGRSGFRQVLEMSAPLDLAVLMLGSNDCKARFRHQPAWDSALNIRQLLLEAGRPEFGPRGTESPALLVVAPAALKEDWGRSWVAEEFDGNSAEKSRRLAPLYARVAEERGAAFLDASNHAGPGADCVHLTAGGHSALGEAVAARAREILKL